MLFSFLPRHGFVFVRLMSLLLAVPLLLGADDSYLLEIENEIKRQATTLMIEPSSAAPAATPMDTTTDSALDRLTPGLQPAAFEQTLRKTLPGTYTLYERLKPASKQQVYDSYRSDNRLASISANVTRLLSGKP